MVTVTSADFNRRPSQIKRTASTGPVVITEHDRPSYVLMTYAQFQELSTGPIDLVDLLAMSDNDDIDFKPLALGLGPADL
jgi:prevent-host-death family protein